MRRLFGFERESQKKTQVREYEDTEKAVRIPDVRDSGPGGANPNAT